MKRQGLSVIVLTFGFTVFMSSFCYSAYHHAGESDSETFVATYPDKAGSKLDGCNLCHTGGSYVQSGKTIVLGSCQYCHSVYGYNKSGDILKTLNPYGLEFLNKGRSKEALTEIEGVDSDGDGYSNITEINAVRFPGDKNDDPTKVPAPYRIYTRDELESLPQHTQFLLMNATKSTDDYVQYAGVTVYEILNDAGIGKEATGITVYSPDGFSQNHPLLPDSSLRLYHVVGEYPQAPFYYDAVADISKNQAGWCNYSSPSASGRISGELISNPDGNRMMLAIKRDGAYLAAGALNKDNKLDGEGPYRLVPPQLVPCPPDQRSTASNQNVAWPYDAKADHNAGFSTRTTTIIRVDPLPPGTTDIDTLEAGWSYVDEAKIVVYGNIDPVPTIKDKAAVLFQTVKSIPAGEFKCTVFKALLLCDLNLMQKLIDKRAYKAAGEILEHGFIKKTDGCVQTAKADKNDWITDCDAQKQAYWASTEIQTLMRLIGR